MNIIKRIWRVISTVLVAVAVIFAVALVGVRLVGFEVYTVLSGSMEPAYHTGSVIWVQECEPEEVQVGDAITFVLNEDLVVATHRVIEVDAEAQHFLTKGDANDVPDAAPVHFQNLIGKPVFTVPHLGYFVNYIQSPPGLYVAIAVCAFVLLLMFLPDLIGGRPEERRRERGKPAVNRELEPKGQPGTSVRKAAPTAPASPVRTLSARPAAGAATARPCSERSDAPFERRTPRHARPVSQQANNPRVNAQRNAASNVSNQEFRTR